MVPDLTPLPQTGLLTEGDNLLHLCQPSEASSKLLYQYQINTYKYNARYKLFYLTSLKYNCLYCNIWLWSRLAFLWPPSNHTKIPVQKELHFIHMILSSMSSCDNHISSNVYHVTECLHFSHACSDDTQSTQLYAEKYNDDSYNMHTK